VAARRARAWLVPPELLLAQAEGDHHVAGCQRRDCVQREIGWELAHGSILVQETAKRIGEFRAAAAANSAPPVGPLKPPNGPSRFCIPPPPPDLDCADIVPRKFRVLAPDPHHFDGNHDGIGCERD